MKANAGQIRAALSRPSPDIRLYLMHGPDEAGASELVRHLGSALGPDAERIDLDGATLRGDPARLADEAASLSLFGGTRYIRVTGVGEESLAAFAALLGGPQAGSPVVAIAPAVKTSAKIVKLVHDSPRAMAFACYAPSAAEVERLAIALSAEQGLRIDHVAARRLAIATGGDRAILAREIDKLVLYCDAAPDRPSDLPADALDLLGADLDDTDTAALVEAVVAGAPAELGREVERLAEAGGSAIPWLRQLARRLVALSEMRNDADHGEPVDAVMKRHRVFFRDEAATRQALRRWTPAMLAEAMRQVRAAERAVTTAGNAGDVLASAAALALARRVAPRR